MSSMAILSPETGRFPQKLPRQQSDRSPPAEASATPPAQLFWIQQTCSRNVFPPHPAETCTGICLGTHIPVTTRGAVSCPRLTSLESRKAGERLCWDPAAALAEGCYLGQELFTTLEAQVNYHFSEPVEAKVLKTVWLIIQTHLTLKRACSFPQISCMWKLLQ